MKASPQLRVDQTKLRQSLKLGFSKEDLRTLCCDLNVDYDDLPGEGTEAKARDLIAHCERCGRTLELVRACQERRPNIDWWGAIQEAQVPAPTPSLPPAPITRTPGSFFSRHPWLPYIIGGVGGLALALLLWLLLVNPGFSPKSQPSPTPSPTATTRPASIPATPVESATMPPPVSLMGLSFMVDDYNLRLVDLRRAASDGIPAGNGSLLQFFDLWFSAPEGGAGYDIQAEIYEDPGLSSLVGTTEPSPLRAGNTNLGNVKVAKFRNDSNGPDIWRVPSHWTDLYIVLVTYCDGQPVDLTVNKIHLDVNGTAWLLDPPGASFASIVYAVNDGPAQVLDLRDAAGLGLSAAPGDTLTLLDLWYHANASTRSEETTAHAEAYLSVEGYDPSTLCRSESNFIEKGVQKLQLDKVTCEHDEDAISFRWIIPDNGISLVISLIRDDRALLDRLVLLLSAQGNPGLVRRLEPVPWHFDHSTYLDFEHEGSDFAGWRRDFRRSSDYAFTGQQSLQFSFNVTETSPSRVFIWRGQDFKAEGLVAHYYLPSEPDVGIEWLQFCIMREAGTEWQCKYNYVTHTRDRWNAVISDFSRLPDKGGLPWNETNVSGFAMQGKITAPGATEPVSYSIYLDAIEIFELEGENP